MPALLEHDDLIAEQERLVDVVRDEDDGLGQFGLQAQHLLLQLVAHDRVDGAEGLVHEQDVGVHRQPACDAHALLLPARELARIAVGEGAGEADGVHQLESARSRGGFRHARQPRHGRDVLERPCGAEAGRSSA